MALPHIAEWVQDHGWIEIGQDEHSTSFVRALDIGGLVWEGKTRYGSLDEAFQYILILVRPLIEQKDSCINSS